ncbi:hypothetical protein [Microlunatus sp. GCM10028923]|uniref:hypothetical protein n=1 Tax=Microlunatus sp. GCM10028923 TaxID=3273400 RepID=UPI0036150A2F
MITKEDGFTVFGSELGGLIRDLDGSADLARDVNLTDFDPRLGGEAADRARLRERLIPTARPQDLPWAATGARRVDGKDRA